MEALAASFVILVAFFKMVMAALPFVIVLIAVVGGLALGAWLVYILSKYFGRR